MKWFKVVFSLLIFLWASLGWGKCLARPLVVASIFPLYEIARDVGGPNAEAYLLLPPGADPHSWEPTPQDLLYITRADVLFVVGHGLEPWFEDLAKALVKKGPRLLLASQGAPLLSLKDHAQGAIDPHIWLDFRWDAVLAKRLGKILAQIDPKHTEGYLARAQATAQRFLALDRTYRHTLSQCRCQTLVLAGHAAFGYLARAYQLKMVSLAGLSPEAEPTPQALAHLIKLLKKQGITAIFYEHPPSRRFAETLARETGARLFYLTPGASLTQEEYEKGLSFFDLMKKNLDHLRKGLQCHP